MNGNRSTQEQTTPAFCCGPMVSLRESVRRRLRILAMLLLTLATRSTEADALWSGTADANFTNPVNWIGGTPDAASIVQFTSSPITQVVVSSSGAAVRGIAFGPQAQAFTISLLSQANLGQSITIGAAGIQNQSAQLERIIATSLNSSIAIQGAGALVSGNVEIDALGLLTSTTFENGASAGSATLVSSGGGQTIFAQASAGASHISVGPDSSLSFAGAATAQAAQIETASAGLTSFNDSASAGAATLLNRGSLIFAGGSSAGHAEITNSATLIFGNNASAGSAQITNLAGGVLQFNDRSQAGQATITNQSGASIVFSGMASGAAARVSNQAGATVDVSGASAAAVALGSLSGAGAVVIGNTTLVLGAAGQDDVISGTVSGGTGGLQKVGSGTLILAGSETYSGETRVSVGQLQLDGTLAADLAIDGAATVSGSGTVGGRLNAAPGALVSAATPGQGLHVKGNVTFAPQSIFAPSITAAGGAAFLSSDSAIQIGGAGLRINALGAPGTYGAGSTYVLLRALGGISGQFASVQSNLATLIPEVRYLPDATEIVLEAAAISAPPTGATPNQTGSAQGLTGIASLVTPLKGIGARDLAQALAALGATPYSALHSLALEGGGAFERDIASRSLAGGLDCMPYGAGSRSAREGPCEALDEPGLHAAWVDLIAARNRITGDRNAAGYQSTSQGIIGGSALYETEALALGAAAQSVRTRLGFDAGQASGQSDAVRVGVRATRRWAWVELTAMLAYGSEEDSLSRSIALPQLERDATGRTTISAWSSLIRADLPIPLAQGWIVPFAALQWITSSGGAFEERGAGAADLTGARDTLNLSVTELGLALAGQLDTPLSLGPIKTDSSLSWIHETGAIDPAILARFSASPYAVGFLSIGPEVPRDYAQLFAGLSWATSHQLSIEARLSGQYGRRGHEEVAYLGASYRW